MVRSEIDVLTPRNLEEALETLQQEHVGLRIIAGGSDVIVQLRDGVMKADKLLNILPLNELRFIGRDGDIIHVGSLATYSDIVNSKLTRDHGWVLVEAAKQIGAIQLQNTATIGGNLGNASPAGDSLPPLYALDAIVVTRSKAGRREIPIEQFFVSYRKTALRPDELIEEVHFKAMNSNDRGSYIKLGLRKANAISIVDVAVVLRGRSSDGSFGEARVALGAVAPVITRARKSESMLAHTKLDEPTLQKAAALASQDAVPIDDIRGSAKYRKEIVVSLVYQALTEALYGRGRTYGSSS
jgi:CO/xanthine dehydrogenase FAD-binding subunit